MAKRRNFHPSTGQEVPPPMIDASSPIAKINYWPPEARGQSTHVRCYMKAEGGFTLEDTVTGLAIDGSGSMESYFGLGPFSPNQVRLVGEGMGSYLAEKIDFYQGTVVVYWATETNPDGIEMHGFKSQEAFREFPFQRPQNPGRRTLLKPVLEFFTQGKHPKTREDFSEHKGFFVVVTDGYIDDFDAVCDYSKRLAQEIEAGSRKDTKIILLGVGHHVDREQMEALDDLDTGTGIDLFLSRIAPELKDLGDVMIESVEQVQQAAAYQARILSEEGAIVEQILDDRVPFMFEFDLPGKSHAFTIELRAEGQDWVSYTQKLPDEED